MKVIARGEGPDRERLDRVPEAMARVDSGKLVVAGGRGGRWLVSEKMGRAGNAGIDFRTDFLVAFQPPEAAMHGGQETARFPGGGVAAGPPPAFLVSHNLR